MTTIKLIFLLGMITVALGLRSPMALAQQAVQELTIPRADMTRASVADAMSQAAQKAGVSVYKEKLVLATRGDTIIASMPTTDDKKGFLFVYVSFAEGSCAQAIPAGFYTIQANTTRKGSPQARFINNSGKTVLVARLERHVRKAFADEENQLDVGIQLRHVERPTGQSARTILGICKCQYIFPFSWRRLHSVIV
jgi:hypothetical protein